jgi:predicted transcriptional regulator
MRKFLLAVLLCNATLWGVTLGEPPKDIVLKDALVSGGDWVLHKDKVQVIFYVDPDEKNINDDFSQALKASNLDKSKFDVIVIVNLKATWIPKFVIMPDLKKEQKKEPEVTFVVDREKSLVHEWGLGDEKSSVLIFDKSGKLVYVHEGKLDNAEIVKVLDLIKQHK